MDEPSAPQRREPVQLLDLPLAWLASLILALDKQAGLKPVSSTCHQLHDLVFSQEAVVPTLRFRTIQELGTPLHVLALAMAEAITSNLHVELRDDCEDPNLLRTKWMDTCTQAASLHAQRTGAAQQPAHVPYKLHCITRTVLGSPSAHGFDDQLHLDSLIPDFLVQGCPNLRELSLYGVTVEASPPAGPQPLICSLEKLTLDRVIFSGGAPSASVRQQLLSLPSLTALRIIRARGGADFQGGGMYRAACDRYSSQLKELWVSRIGEMPHLPWSPSIQFPHLQQLDLPGFSVESDAVMQQLMQATPSLVRLQLWKTRGLTTSFAQEPCSWQELSLGWVYVDQLAWLPLASCTRIQCNGGIQLSQDGLQPTSGQIAAGVSAVQAAGGLQFSERVSITLYIDDMQHIPAARPIWEQLHGEVRIDVYTPDVDATWSHVQPVVAALGQQHLRCKQVEMDSHKEDEPGGFAQLPELLPHVQGFGCWCQRVDDVVEMCRAATRPFTLYLFSSQADLKEVLEEVLEEVDHELVTLQME